MNETIVKLVLKKYGMHHAVILPAQKGYRNQSHPVMLADGRIINLILYKNEPDILTRIHNADTVAGYAAARGLPARQRVRVRIMTLHTKNHTRYLAVYAYLPGSTIPWEAYTQAHLKLLGAGLSDLHAVLAHCSPPAALPAVADEHIALLGRMYRYLSDHQVSMALHKKLGLTVDVAFFVYVERILKSCRHLPNQQPLHMDFVRGNILFDWQNDHLTISGILDFEKTAYGHPVFDIARTLAFLIVDCKYKPEEKVRKYFLHSGYRKRGSAPYHKLIWQKKDVREELVNFFLFHDFYKFLRHNPYEMLPQNEHFTKTREVLCKRGIIS